MDYKGFVDQSIVEAKREHESIVNNLLKIKTEYNALLVKKEKVIAELNRLGAQFLKESVDYEVLKSNISEVEKKLQDERVSVIQTYEKEEERIKKLIEENENILAKVKKEQTHLETLKKDLEEREKTIRDSEEYNKLAVTQINAKLSDIHKKEREIQAEYKKIDKKEGDLILKDQRITQDIQIRETGIALREDNLRNREEQIKKDLALIESEWKQIKSAKTYLKV